MGSPAPAPFSPRLAIEHLTRRDPRMGRLIAAAEEFQLPREPERSPYEALFEAIVYQSISGKAAATIFTRVVALGRDGRLPAPGDLAKLPAGSLRAAGLSGAKVAAVKDLADKTLEGVVPTLEQARGMSDQELVARLVGIRGVGAWTVEMFLIFRLGRPDVLPIHDYGVQKGFALTYGKRRIPTPGELAAFGERWRPYRTVAAWYLWRAVQLAGPAAGKIRKSARRATRSATTARTAKRRAPTAAPARHTFADDR